MVQVNALESTVPMPSEMDYFFKSLIQSAPEFADQEDGESESPTGAFGIFHVPPSNAWVEDTEEYLGASASEWWIDYVRNYWVPAHGGTPNDGPSDEQHPANGGWFYVKLNDQGLVWAYPMEDQEHAQQWFDDASTQYSAWANDAESVY